MTGIYFSGTGNTKFCISRFLSGIEGEHRLLSIEDSAAVSEISGAEEILFAYPVYYSSLPKIVGDFIVNNKDLWRGKRIFIIATMGAFSGDGSGVSARLFQKYGAEITGGLHIKMPDCIGDVKALKKSPDENRRIIASAEEKIDKAAKNYPLGKPPREGLNIFYHLAGLFGQRLYFSGKTKHYTRNPKISAEKCVGCGNCEKLCPMRNIHIADGKAVPGNKCTMCYRCFSLCPKQAITIIGKKVIVQYNFNDYSGKE